MFLQNFTELHTVTSLKTSLHSYHCENLRSNMVIASHIKNKSTRVTLPRVRWWCVLAAVKVTICPAMIQNFLMVQVAANLCARTVCLHPQGHIMGWVSNGTSPKIILVCIQSVYILRE